MPLALALCRLAPSFFENQPVNAEIALRAVRSVDDLSRVILGSESSALAGRFVGAYNFLGDRERADQIASTARSAGIRFEPKNPFTQVGPVLAGGARLLSPYVGRIEALFRNAREPVLEVFSGVSSQPLPSVEGYLRHLEAAAPKNSHPIVILPQSLYDSSAAAPVGTIASFQAGS